jgi:hypothetical protein
MPDHRIHETNEHFTAYYNDSDQVFYVQYHGTVTPAVSARFYQWLIGLLPSYPQEVAQARGSIYDFRDVVDVASTNLSSAQRQSQQINQQADLQNHPVAVIARDRVQQGLLSVTMKISPQSDRKRVVQTEDEALAFIDDFHRKHPRPQP